jgi:glutamate synthase (ferredoxin)
MSVMSISVLACVSFFSLLSFIFAEEFGTHKVLQQGLSALNCMEHRGACGGDGISGDGAGIMTEIPWKLFAEYRSEGSPEPGVGMIFLPKDETRRNSVKEKIEQVLKINELEFLGWREVPVDVDVLGPNARKSVPSIWQFFVKSPERLSNDDSDRDGFERTLYLVRRRFAVVLRDAGLMWDDDDGDTYVASFSSRTIVYKGMVQSAVLSQFYKDLTNPDYTTKFVIYHRRFSTNTNPRWPLAQPMRVVGHNGEINTLLGNVNWIKAREASKGIPDDAASDDLVDYDSTENIVTMCNTQDIPSVLEPVVDLSRSDSANLDSVFELMCQSRHRAPCALMAMVPTAYLDNPDLKNNPEITDFYKFHGGLLEAWDGPALLVFSDGKSIGASLDRNGLRPARYSIAKDGSVYMMSETGVIPGLLESEIVEKGRLGPGQMINVDLLTGEFKDNIKIKSEIAKRKFFLACRFHLLKLTISHRKALKIFVRRSPLWRVDCETTKGRY